MPSQAILRIDGVPFFHAGISVGLGQDRCSRNRDAARVTLDQGFLLDHHVELHRVNQQVVGPDGELFKRRLHRLAAGLIDIPRVNALRVYFGNGPGNRVLMNPLGKLGSPFGKAVSWSRPAQRCGAWDSELPPRPPRDQTARRARLRPDPQYESIQAAAPLARNGKEQSRAIIVSSKPNSSTQK